jgi:hypothetical protein
MQAFPTSQVLNTKLNVTDFCVVVASDKYQLLAMKGFAIGSLYYRTIRIPIQSPNKLTTTGTGYSYDSQAPAGGSYVECRKDDIDVLRRRYHHGPLRAENGSPTRNGFAHQPWEFEFELTNSFSVESTNSFSIESSKKSYQQSSKNSSTIRWHCVLVRVRAPGVAHSRSWPSLQLRRSWCRYPTRRTVLCRWKTR